MLCQTFDLDRVTRKDSVFDEKKLNWMNGCYIRELGPKKLAQNSKDWFAKAVILGHEQAKSGTKTVPSLNKIEAAEEARKIKHYDQSALAEAAKYVEANFETFEKTCPLLIERLNRLDEIPAKLSFMFWGKSTIFDEKSQAKALQKEGSRAKDVLDAVLPIFEDESIA